MFKRKVTVPYLFLLYKNYHSLLFNFGAIAKKLQNLHWVVLLVYSFFVNFLSDQGFFKEDLFFRTTTKNMAKVNTYLGMTVPISLDGPKTQDVERTQALIKALEPHGCFESESELSHRMEVLATLNTLIKDWIKDLSIEKNMPADVAETIGGHVYTFGSYRLGTVNPKLRIPLGNC